MTNRTISTPGQERLSDAETERLLELVASHVASVPDFPKPGILFRDITPILADAVALQAAMALHLDRIADLVGTVDKIVAMESRGFLFGVGVAERLGVGFVPVRKPGKLPRETIEERYELEYGTDALQMHADAIAAGERVIVVDDLLATGGTAAAARALIERAGAQVVACLFLIELRELGGRQRLPGARVESILEL